jgi:hypothetical protein
LVCHYFAVYSDPERAGSGSAALNPPNYKDGANMDDALHDCGCSPMDTQIFNQGLSVPAASAYIMIAALTGDGVKPNLQALLARWNAERSALDEALAELAGLNIIKRRPGPGGGDPIYTVNPASMWRPRD